MAYNFNSPQQQSFSAAPQQFNQQQQIATPMTQQNVQPLFPQPQGNVYNINSTLEVANVPVGAGISVALCLNEGFMYIKTMQNGNPLFWAYKITPYDSSTKPNEEETSAAAVAPDFSEQFKNYDKKFQDLEVKIEDIQKILKKKNNNKGEWDL